MATMPPLPRGADRDRITARLIAAAEAGTLYAAAYGTMRAEVSHAAALLDGGDERGAWYVLRRAVTVEEVAERLVVDRLAPAFRVER